MRGGNRDTSAAHDRDLLSLSAKTQLGSQPTLTIAHRQPFMRTKSTKESLYLPILSCPGCPDYPDCPGCPGCPGCPVCPVCPGCPICPTCPVCPTCPGCSTFPAHPTRGTARGR